MGTIEQSNDHLQIKLEKFDPKIVAIIKQLPSIRFDPQKRLWYCPIDTATATLIEPIVAQLNELGFTGGMGQLAEFESLRIDYSDPFLSLLYPYQRTGMEFLVNQNGLLGDEPGLGKTIQSIAAIQVLKPKKVLVLTFASLKYQFASELEKFYPDSTFIVINGDKKTRVKQWNTDNQFYIANYELLLHDLPEMMREWEIILCDECTRLSNHTNKQSKALQSLKANKKIAMTGTAISNSPLDLYGIINWLYPSVLGNHHAFINKYSVKGGFRGKQILGFKNLDHLAERIKPFYLRRTKDQVLPDLPEKIKIELPFELSVKERNLYDQIRMEMLLEIEKIAINKIDNPVMMQSAVVKIMRLRQLANGMELLGEHIDSTKLSTLKDLLSTLGDGKKIIFSEFAEMCKILQRELPGSLMIIGEVNALARDKIVEKFNTNPDIKILIMSSAGAYGLNLQAADVVIHYDLPFSIAKYIQRSSRAHRMGQKNTVYEYSLVARKTIDEWVRKKLEEKQAISEMVMPLSEIKELLNI